MIGTIFNQRYRIDKELGKGGMGTVYRAFDTTLERDIALKVLSNTGLGTEGRAHMLREAKTVANLHHPNIVVVHDAGEYEGSPYIVMELVEGKTLHEQKTESFEEIIEVAKQICQALDHAHKRDIIHRDLKPENVIIEPDGNLMLMDFGLAQSVATRMTSDGMIVGTVYYMAPEQAMGHELDSRVDLYALGVMLYELTTGMLPFEANDPIAIITQHINAPVIPPRVKRENIPIFLNNLILKLLEKEPGDRYQSAKAVLELLESPEDKEESLTESQELSMLDRVVRGRIVGRKDEYEEARQLWNQATAGDGQILLISGEPGIGKTRLMREIVTQAEVSGGRALIGEAYEESNTPYAAFAQIIRNSLDKQFQNGLEFPDFVLDDLLNLVPDLRPYYPDIESNPQLDPEFEQNRLFENMVTFFQAISGIKPLLLVLDDAHWADSNSIALFKHLARRTKKLPVMLLATYREVELREARPFNEMLLELNRQRLGTRLKLDRLNHSQTKAMLSTIFNEDISPEFLESIYHETDGNPFFIEEICRVLIESGVLYFEEGNWHRPEEMADMEIPQGIQVAVESRLIKLPEDVQEILRIAAILGREFDYEVLIEACEMEEDTVIEAIEMADQAQMLQEGREDTLYEFVHALVPQSIRENTHRLRRRKIHKQAALAFETIQPDNYEAIAYHYSEGGNDVKALEYYILAGERALANYANQDALEHVTSALNLVEIDQQKAGLLTQRGEAQDRLSLHKEAILSWRQAIDLYLAQGDKDRVAELYALAGRAAWAGGDTKINLDICREGLVAVEGVTEGPGLANLLSETARACYFNGVRDEVEIFANRALEMSKQFNLPAVQAESLNTLGTFLGASSEAGIQMLEEAIQISESANLFKEANRANNNLGVVYSIQGNYEEAIIIYQRSVEIDRQMGNRNSELFSTINLLYCLLFLGQIQEVEKGINEMKDFLETIPEPGSGERSLRGMEVWLLMAKGELDDALQLGNKNIKRDREINDLYNLKDSLAIQSHIYLILGNFQRAEEVALEGLDIALNFSEGAILYSSASVAASKRGALQRAAKYLENANLLMQKSQPTFWDQSFYIRAEAHLLTAQNKVEESWKKYAKSQDMLETKKIFFASAWFKTEWAEALLSQGKDEDTTRAIELFEEVLVEFETMGSSGWVQLVKGKLENSKM